jgi:hypothetical protein
LSPEGGKERRGLTRIMSMARSSAVLAVFHPGGGAAGNPYRDERKFIVMFSHGAEFVELH